MEQILSLIDSHCSADMIKWHSFAIILFSREHGHISYD